MKKIFFLTLIFIIYAILIKTCPVITLWDKSIIIFIQKMLKDLPLFIPLLPDCSLYSAMIVLPLVIGTIYFFRKKDWLSPFFLLGTPLAAFLFNCVIKNIIQRVRPPFEMQPVIHPDSYSFVSSHSLVTMCLYGIIIYWFVDYFANKKISKIIVPFSTLWILFVGFSRIWIGVHYPTDVIGAYFLGYILLCSFILLYEKINKKDDFINLGKVLVVTNFNAGRKQVIKYKKIVNDFLLKRTEKYKFVDVDEFKNTDVSEFDKIFVMGGDGTVNKVLPYVVNTNKVLGIIPCGTANLLAAKLGFSQDLDKNLKIIDKNKVKPIDVLSVNEKLCGLRFGLGYDSDIICKTPQSLKNKFGYFAYFIAGIMFGFRLKNKEYEAVFDDQSLKFCASCVIIANSANMYKNFAEISDNSSLDDGFADIFILKTTNPIIFFFIFCGVVLKIRKNCRFVEYYKAKYVQIKNNWLICHIDGEKNNLQNDIEIKTLSKILKVYYD